MKGANFFFLFSPPALPCSYIFRPHLFYLQDCWGKSKINSTWWLEELVFEKSAREEHHLCLILKHLVFLIFKWMHRLATKRCRARSIICIHCSVSSLYCELKPDTCWDLGQPKHCFCWWWILAYSLHLGFTMLWAGNLEADTRRIRKRSSSHTYWWDLVFQVSDKSSV